MTCDVMYKGFDIDVAIIPPAGLVLGDVRMYAQSPRGKRIEFASATTQSFAQMLGMSKDQLRAAMTEARGL